MKKERKRRGPQRCRLFPRGGPSSSSAWPWACAPSLGDNDARVVSPASCCHPSLGADRTPLRGGDDLDLAASLSEDSPIGRPPTGGGEPVVEGGCGATAHDRLYPADGNGARGLGGVAGPAAGKAAAG